VGVIKHFLSRCITDIIAENRETTCYCFRAFDVSVYSQNKINPQYKFIVVNGQTTTSAFHKLI